MGPDDRYAGHETQPISLQNILVISLRQIAKLLRYFGLYGYKEIQLVVVSPLEDAGPGVYTCRIRFAGTDKSRQ